ncbi:MAG TPA: hypothetical protein VLG28_09940, partial [Acidimicrobiia bacterium]|nr:hypothetical protein [Acidimicrobiia bacterium]
RCGSSRWRRVTAVLTTSYSSEGRLLERSGPKRAGTTLTGVEIQTAKYTTGLPEDLTAPIRPLPFAYESTGVETRFTNGLDPEPRSREVFAFHRPETMVEWVRDWGRDRSAPSLRARLAAMPTLDPAGLWPAQQKAIRNLEE